MPLRAEGELTSQGRSRLEHRARPNRAIRTGPGTGPALLCSNIKDYNNPSPGPPRFAGSMSNYRPHGDGVGLPPDTHPRELVKLPHIMDDCAPTKVATAP